MKVHIITGNEDKLDTGAVRVPGDSTGIFLRGERARYYAAGLSLIYEKPSTDILTALDYDLLIEMIELLGRCPD